MPIFPSAEAKPFGIPCEESARCICEILASARDGELDKLGGHRREHNGDDGENHQNRIPLLVTTSSSATPEGHAQEKISEKSDESCEHYRDSHKKYVSILYVREFMADNALKLGTCHLGEESGRRADDGVFLVATGRKRIWRGVVNHIELRFRQSRRDGEILGDGIEIKNSSLEAVRALLKESTSLSEYQYA